MRELVRRGRSVCYIKHTHEEPTLDGEDTDTARIRRAGAAAAVLAGARSTVVFRAPGDESLERIALRDSLPGEIVIAEGFKGAPGKKIVVAGGDLDVASLDGVVGARRRCCPRATRDRSSAPDEIAPLRSHRGSCRGRAGRQGWTTSLTIDGREIPVNAFVQDILASGLLGMAAPLQNVEGGDDARDPVPKTEGLMRIKVDKSKCTGCKLCQQICTIEHYHEINPKKAAIQHRGRVPGAGRLHADALRAVRGVRAGLPRGRPSSAPGARTRSSSTRRSARTAASASRPARSA